MKLVSTVTGYPVEEGHIVHNSHGVAYRVLHFREPHKPSSSGKIYVETLDADPWRGEYYVGCFGLEWIDREDRA